MTTYHEVAGTRVDRIAGLSDALFAIALTRTASVAPQYEEE